ncbi:hypothetical protein ACFYKX_03210 [Cytobacillus sp. FJAT-54145]|uniref:N-formylglutamate amidohydrolase n=1 Tax=Cytobacillus spartinae TaxID=3299023 RepID=A0ABW6K619_9BACI
MKLPICLLTSFTFISSQIIPFNEHVVSAAEQKPVAFHVAKQSYHLHKSKRKMGMWKVVRKVKLNRTDLESTSSSNLTSEVNNSLSGEEKLSTMFEDKSNFLKKILSYEQQFSMNSYGGDTYLTRPVEYKKGSIPILISAPHATEHIRDGKVKSADIYTGSLALLLGELTNTHVVYSSRIADDPNYIKGGIYKDTLNKIVSENNIQYIIDLHGAASERTFDIDLGTINGKSMDSETVDKFTAAFKANNITDITVNGTFAAETEGTITNYSYNVLHKNSVQIEINKEYRNPRNDIDSYYSVLNSLVNIVNELQ